MNHTDMKNWIELNRIHNTKNFPRIFESTFIGLNQFVEIPNNWSNLSCFVASNRDHWTISNWFEDAVFILSLVGYDSKAVESMLWITYNFGKCQAFLFQVIYINIWIKQRKYFECFRLALNVRLILGCFQIFSQKNVGRKTITFLQRWIR